jgi:hypothetical protein
VFRKLATRIIGVDVLITFNIKFWTPPLKIVPGSASAGKGGGRPSHAKKTLALAGRNE